MYRIMASQTPFPGSLTFIFEDPTPPSPSSEPIRARYESTPWSQRPSPSQTPQPAFVVSSSPNPSQNPNESPANTPLRSVEGSEGPADSKEAKKRVVKQWWKSESNRTALLRICLEKQELYGHIADKGFWSKVSKRYSEISGHPPHQTLSRVVSGWIKERREFLVLLESGEQDEDSSYNTAIDSWISVVDLREARKEEIAERQGRADQETAESTAWRNRQFQTIKGKRKAGSDTEDRDGDGDETSFGSPFPSTASLLVTSSSPAPSSSISQRSTRKSRKKGKKRRSLHAQDNESDDLFISKFSSLVDHVVTRSSSSVGDSSLRADIDAVTKRVLDIEGGINKILELLGNRS